MADYHAIARTWIEGASQAQPARFTLCPLRTLLLAKSPSINGDSLEYEKRGRLLKDHHYEAAARARAAALLIGGRMGYASKASQRSLHQRPAAASSAGSRAFKEPSRESVLKVIQWTKAAETPKRQARYVARVRADDEQKGREPIPMENERGETIIGRAEIDREIRSWGLIPDRENLLKAARTAAPEQLAAMKSGDRLDRRQAVHIIFSIPAQTVTESEKLRDAVRAGLAETFGDAEHRYVFAIHTEHNDKPHAHIIVKAAAERDQQDRGRGKAMRLNPAELQTIRHILTRHAQERGIDVIATRREDRTETRAKILDGQEPLRADQSWHQRKQTKQGLTFERTAPEWYMAHGADYERRKIEARAGSSMPQASPGNSENDKKPRGGLFARLFGTSFEREASDSAEMSKLKGYYGNFANVRAGRAIQAAASKGEAPALAQLESAFHRSHYDARAARTSFLEMYREAPKLAVWAAHNHPEAFGPTTGVKPDRITTKLLKELPLGDRPNEQAWSREHERAQRAEIQELRRISERVRARDGADKRVEGIRRSLERAATFAERAITHDPAEAKETAEEIRRMAREVTQRIATPAETKAGQYAELEDRLRRQDRRIGQRLDWEKE